MEWGDAYKVAMAIITSLGGVSVVVIGLVAFLGKLWTNRILESEKHKNNLEIAKVKKNLETELEKVRVDLNLLADQGNMRFTHYAKAQFDLYCKLWEALVELSDHVETLWIEANQANFKKFVNSLKKAKRNIRSAAIILEPEHYMQLIRIIEHFENYEMGKYLLIESMSNGRSYDEYKVKDLIRSNGQNKDVILGLIDQTLNILRDQINGRV